MRLPPFAPRAAITALALITCHLTSLSAADPLPGTAPLEWTEEDLSGRMMDGAHRFIETQIGQAREKRQRYWTPVSKENIDASRRRLREIIGAVDQRSAPRMERFGDDLAPALVAETERTVCFRYGGLYWTGSRQKVFS